MQHMLTGASCPSICPFGEQPPEAACLRMQPGDAILQGGAKTFGDCKHFQVIYQVQPVGRCRVCKQQWSGSHSEAL